LVWKYFKQIRSENLHENIKLNMYRANKYQINNSVMFNNLFCRFWQVINFVKKDQHSLKSCVGQVVTIAIRKHSAMSHDTSFLSTEKLSIQSRHRIILPRLISRPSSYDCSNRVQWLIKCWINDTYTTVNRTFNCLGAMIF
jgi:hypothetical protein